jgi:hypothetical protein
VYVLQNIAKAQGKGLGRVGAQGIDKARDVVKCGVDLKVTADVNGNIKIQDEPGIVAYLRVYQGGKKPALEVGIDPRFFMGESCLCLEGVGRLGVEFGIFTAVISVEPTVTGGNVAVFKDGYPAFAVKTCPV